MPNHRSRLRRAWPVMAAVAALSVLLASQLQARNPFGPNRLEMSYSFAGGGASGLAACRDGGTLPVGYVGVVERDATSFTMVMYYVAGTPLPCLGSTLPDNHQLHVYGETADGEPSGFPESASPWQLAVQLDDGPKLPLGCAWLLATGPDSWEIAWAGGEIPGLPGLTLFLRDVPELTFGDDEPTDGKRVDDKRRKEAEADRYVEPDRYDTAHRTDERIEGGER